MPSSKASIRKERKNEANKKTSSCRRSAEKPDPIRSVGNPSVLEERHGEEASSSKSGPAGNVSLQSSLPADKVITKNQTKSSSRATLSPKAYDAEGLVPSHPAPFWHTDPQTRETNLFAEGRQRGLDDQSSSEALKRPEKPRNILDTDDQSSRDRSRATVDNLSEPVIKEETILDIASPAGLDGVHDNAPGLNEHSKVRVPAGHGEDSAALPRRTPVEEAAPIVLFQPWAPKGPSVRLQGSNIEPVDAHGTQSSLTGCAQVDEKQQTARSDQQESQGLPVRSSQKANSPAMGGDVSSSQASKDQSQPARPFPSVPSGQGQYARLPTTVPDSTGAFPPPNTSLHARGPEVKTMSAAIPSGLPHAPLSTIAEGSAVPSETRPLPAPPPSVETTIAAPMRLDNPPRFPQHQGGAQNSLPAAVRAPPPSGPIFTGSGGAGIGGMSQMASGIFAQQPVTRRSYPSYVQGESPDARQSRVVKIANIGPNMHMETLKFTLSHEHPRAVHFRDCIEEGCRTLFATYPNSTDAQIAQRRINGRPLAGGGTLKATLLY